MGTTGSYYNNKIKEIYKIIFFKIILAKYLVNKVFKDFLHGRIQIKC